MDNKTIARPREASPLYLEEGEECAIPRELTHRERANESFLTSITCIGTNSFTLRATLPGDHPFFVVDDQGRHDPILIAETMRQAGIVVAHLGFGVPLGTQFLMTDISFQVLDPVRLSAAGPAVEIELALSCSEIVRKAAELRQTRFQVSISRSTAPSGPLARGSGFLLCIPGAVYARMRLRRSRLAGDAPAFEAVGEILPPALVGRRHERDVLLVDTGGWRAGAPSADWNVRVDPSHAGLFDHPLDHIPGMVQLEALRQAAMALTQASDCAGAFSGCEVQFLRMIEVSEPVSCKASMLDPGTVAVTLLQGDRPPFTQGTIALDR